MLKKSFSKAKPVCKVTFSLPLEAAKGGKEVRILGDFNGWSWEKGYAMKAGKTEFSTEVELASGKEYEFRYLIDNHIWENDWKADNYVPTSTGVYNSVVSLIEEKAAAKAAPKAAAKAEVKTPAEPKKAPAPKAAAAKAATDKAAPAAKSEAKPAAKKAAAPKVAAKKTTGADDLTKIEGVGPKIAELLTKGGIVTFADLAKAKTETLKGILEAAGKRYQMHDPSTWASQAALAAKADWAKLEKLQGELKGGKR